MHDIITLAGSEEACYVSSRLEFHCPGSGLSNVRTGRRIEAARTENHRDKCPEGWRACRFREL